MILRPQRGGAVRALAVLTSVCGVGLAGWGHSGGDPGGRVLQTLEPVETAVPPGSSSVAVHKDHAVWQAKCPHNPGGRSGWSEVLVSAAFTTPLPPAEVIANVESRLNKLGWSRHDTEPTMGKGSIPRWTKSVGSGAAANAFLYPIPNGSQHWFLTAGWKPPGFALPGC